MRAFGRLKGEGKMTNTKRPSKVAPAHKAYNLGFDCGLNGDNDDNCYFAIFVFPELSAEWQRGKRDAEAGRRPKYAG